MTKPEHRRLTCLLLLLLSTDVSLRFFRALERFDLLPLQASGHCNNCSDLPLFPPSDIARDRSSEVSHSTGGLSL